MDVRGSGRKVSIKRKKKMKNEKRMNKRARIKKIKERGKETGMGEKSLG